MFEVLIRRIATLTAGGMDQRVTPMHSERFVTRILYPSYDFHALYFMCRSKCSYGPRPLKLLFVSYTPFNLGISAMRVGKP